MLISKVVEKSFEKTEELVREISRKRFWNFNRNFCQQSNERKIE